MRRIGSATGQGGPGRRGVQAVDEDFSAELHPRWRRYLVGGGRLEPTGSSLRFVVADASARRYADAQIDDYQGLPRWRFPWRPPLRLTVRARFSHPAGELAGTAGFGFWNDPFLMTGARVPTLPRAAWFFYASPRSNMKLDLEVPGHGWKVATIDALRPSALLLAPLAPLAVPLMNLRPLYRALWTPIQRALNVREALLPVEMTEWHTYVLEWERGRARFSVDGTLWLDAPSPHGPLGFVMWLDNQYMVVTPQGRLGWGLLEVTGRQWMEVDCLRIGP
ncbi:MAG TPA: hypothetical protein EYH30_05305 [Anaerolineales bacterium]|nr:hypothetical protein [Anaerolineae bacterium]HIQ01530.1 hypothetical protein [Anaerolineales bacterium]